MLKIKQPDTNVLNLCDKPPQCQKSGVDVSKELQKKMLSMKAEFMSEDGNAIDYEALKKSQLFTDYKSSTFNLYSVDIASLSEKEKQAFFINIYNALTIHGLASCTNLPSSVLDIQQFWKVTAYSIGSHVFSLDDMEHGILRGNQSHPSAKEPQFKSDDPRVAFTVKEKDPRIHFALVCGAKSCPAIQVYSAENVDRALDAATKSFCEQEVKVYEIQREIRASPLFQWYCGDFGENDVEALRWALPYLSEQKAKDLKSLLYKVLHEGMVNINYSEYDWKLNSKSNQTDGAQAGTSDNNNHISPRDKKPSPRDKKVSPRDKKKS